MVDRKTERDEIVINSDYMKIIVASYYRFILQNKYTCTEFERMDVCTCNDKYMIEIEIKVTKSDLKNEKKHKLKKHSRYSTGKQIINKYIIPNKYYICIPDYMLDKDKEYQKIIEDLNPKYGIMVIRHDNPTQPFEIKSAEFLHKKEVTQEIKDQIIKRMSSENIGLRQKLYDLKIKENNKNGEEK